MAFLLGAISARAELTPYTGPTLNLPANRSTFSFGSLATGGAAANSSSSFLVDNMPDLRVALSLPYSRIGYVKGNITGHEMTSDPANGRVETTRPEFLESMGSDRNLKLTQPKDCFPASEKVEPDTAWNARYDALSLVTSTNLGLTETHSRTDQLELLPIH
ncbi:hypothetical protein DL95DRAFT_469915 [Leptodontidium sp. 2 PMI_412]|nr:hypothetical protein DL95DRAFT_469915 [Leptodontidium sp. 2 PMI_412]